MTLLTSDIWPDAALELQMLADAELVEQDQVCSDWEPSRNLALHVRALLDRVRHLERESADYRAALDTHHRLHLRLAIHLRAFPDEALRKMAEECWEAMEKVGG